MHLGQAPWLDSRYIVDAAEAAHSKGPKLTDIPSSDRLQIVEERLHVDKREVETDRVRIRTVVDERDVTLEGSIERGHLDVERVTVEREVSEAPSPREEGDVLIVSVVEERAEIVTRLFVVEELHIRRTSVTEAVALPTTMRSMRAIVDRGDHPSLSGEN